MRNIDYFKYTMWGNLFFITVMIGVEYGSFLAIVIGLIFAMIELTRSTVDDLNRTLSFQNTILTQLLKDLAEKEKQKIKNLN